MSDEHGGYMNAETYRFEIHAPNVFSIYTDVSNVARVMLEHVPSMTDQTLGANIKLHVRTWVLDAREGRPLRNYGWADHVTVTSTPAQILELSDYVGDLSMLSETDLGASWPRGRCRPSHGSWLEDWRDSGAGDPS